MKKYQWENKLSFSDRRQIIYEYSIGAGLSELAKKYNVNHATIHYYVKNIKQKIKPVKIKLTNAQEKQTYFKAHPKSKSIPYKEYLKKKR